MKANKIFTYGFKDIEPLRWKFGEAEYLDVTSQYQDIMALPNDMVIVNMSNIDPDVLTAIKEYEAAVKDESTTKFVYVNSDQYEMWYRNSAVNRFGLR